MIRMLPLSLLLIGCGPEDDGKGGFTTGGNTTGTEGTCDVIEERSLAIDETVGNPMNFSGQNALDELTGVTNTTNVFEYPDELTINAHVEFIYDGGAVAYRVREKNGILPAAELAKCLSAIEVEGTLLFSTGDGAFDEAIPVTLKATERKLAYVIGDLDPAAITGTWTPADSELDAGTLGSYVIEFNGDIDPLGSEGVMTAVNTDGDRYPVGSWHPPSTQG